MAAGPYTRTSRWSGETLNLRTIEMLIAAERRCGFPLVVTQGSYNAGVSQSGGTHDGGGALDVRVADLSSSQRDSVVYQLRKVGFAAWLRTPSQGDWPYHIHAIAIGDQEMSPAAADQVVDYKNGRNGLANNGPDDGPRVAWTQYRQELDVSFYGPENWDTADRERFEEYYGWKFNIRDEVKDDGSIRNADTMLAYTHKNSNLTKTSSAAAEVNAASAASQAAAAQTAAGAAEQAAAATLQAVQALELRLFPPA